MEATAALRFVVRSVRKGFEVLQGRENAPVPAMPACLQQYHDARVRRAERKLEARLSPFSPARFTAALALCLSLLISTSPVMGAINGDSASVYNGPSGTAVAPITGTWSASTNWDSQPGSGLNTEIDFGGSGATAYTATDDIAGTFTLNAIVLNSTATVSETIAGNALSMVTNGSAVLPSIVQSGTGAFTISNAIALTNNLTFTTTAGGTGAVTLSGILSGAGTLTVGGTGANLTVSGVNTFTGTTSVNSGGILKLGNGAALGTTTTSGVTVAAGGTLDINAQNALNRKTLTIAGSGVGGVGAYINSSTTDQINGVETLVLSGNATIGGAGRLDNRANGGTATFNMGGFTLNTAMTGGKYFALVGSTISNAGAINVNAGGLSLETTTNMAGTGNLLTVANGAYVNYFGFTGTDNWTHVMLNGSKVQTNNTNSTSTVGGQWQLQSGTVSAAPASTDTLTLNGLVFGAGGLNLNGAGTLNLNAVNTFTGGMTVSSGILNINNNGAAGAGVINQTGGVLNETIANGILNGNSLNFTGGVANLSRTNNYTGGATISGTSVTNVTAAGALQGNTVVTGGTLSSGIVATAGNNGTITLSGGALTSAAAGGQFQNVTLSGNGIINPGGVGTFGTGALTISNLTTTGGTLQFDNFGPVSGSDLLNVAGTFNVGAGTNIGFNLGRPNAAGNYKLIQYSGATPNLANFVLPTAPGGLSYSLSSVTDPGFIDLVVSGARAFVSGNWIPTAAGPFSWNAAANWVGGAVPSATGDTANFNSVLTANQTVTVDGQQHVGTLTLNPGGGFSFTVNAGTAGSTIYMDNGASAAAINNTAGNNTIAAPVNLVSSNTNVSLASGNTLTISGVIGGTGNLTLTGGTGNLVLSNAGNTFAGTITAQQGVLLANADGQFGAAANGVVLNGGTLSYNATTGTLTFGGGRTLTIGAAGGTVDIPTVAAANPSTAKILLSVQNASLLQGSGTLTKTSNGDLQLGNGEANTGFTGNVVINGGVVEAQNALSLGVGGTVTINAGGELVNTNVAIANNLVLNGGTVSANGAGNGVYSGTLNVTANSTLAARLFQTTTTSNNFAISGALSGSGNLAITTGSTAGVVTLAGAAAPGTYTGAITVNNLAGLGILSGRDYGTGITVASGGTLMLAGDGNTSGTPETLGYTLTGTPITFSTGNLGYAVGRAGFGVNGGRTGVNALNKTIAVANLPLNSAGTLAVTPFNGYGLSLTASAALAANTTYSVAGTQASNVVAGLTVSNLAGGGFNVTKTGTGTLVLGGTNGFGGVGNFIDVVQGVVASASDGALGASGTVIKLDATGTNAATFRGIGNFTTGREIDLNSTNPGSNVIEVANGNTTTLSGVLVAAAAGNNLTKGEAGTLVMSNTVSGAWTGGLQIFQGAVQLTSDTGNAGQGALGNAPVTIFGGPGQGQAALQLNPGVGGSVNLGSTINLNPSTTANLFLGGINFHGQLESVTGNNTISGAVSLTADAAIGVDTGSTLTINGIAGMTTTTTRALNLVTQAGGTMNLAGNISSGTAASYFGINKFGAGTLNITAAQSAAITSQSGTGGFGIQGGTVNLRDGGMLNGTYTNGIAINYGSTLNLDNTGTAVSSRLGGGTNGLTFTSGTLSLLGNAGNTVSETLKSITLGRGENVFTIGNQVGDTTGETDLNLTSGGAFTRAAFGSTLFQTINGTTLGTSQGVGGVATITTGSATPTFQGGGNPSVESNAGAPAANYGILPWAVVNNNGTISFATTTTTTTGSFGLIRNLTAGESVGSFVNATGAATVSTFFNGSNSVTVADPTGLFIGEGISGTGIAAGTFITGISGNSVSLSANATADSAATGNVLAFGTTGTNINLGAGTTGPLPATVNNQAINSLTLQAGANLTLGNAPQTLTIGGAAGGGILAVGNSTISGGLITAGTNELIVHTVGNLTLNSAITGGATGAGNGLTKGESGTLTLGGTAFYSGQTVIDAGTLKLNAGANNANSIWYQNYLTVVPGATVDLNGRSQLVTDLFNDNAIDAAITGGSIINTGAGSATMVLNRDASNRFWSGDIAGNVNLLRSGSNANTWSVLGSNSTTGNVLLNDGTTILRDNGSFLNISSLGINYANLTFDQNGTNDLSARLSPTLPITLRGGAIAYTGRVQTQGKMSLGAVTFAEGVSDIVATAGGTGVNSVDLTLADLIQGSRDASINFRTVNGTMGSNARLLISTYEGNTPAKSNVNNILGGWGVTNGNEFATYISGLGVAPLNTAGAAGYDAAVIPGTVNNPTQNIRLTASGALPAGGLNVNSVNFEPGAAVSLSFGNGTAGVTDTLNLTSGGLLKGVAQNVTIGNVVDNGVLTAGGVGASGPQTLYIHNNNGSAFTINSRITDNGAAPVRAVFTQYNAGVTTLADPNNSWTGGTVVNGWISGGTGNLTIGATGKLPAGGLTMNGANVTQTAGGIIDPSNTVTINGLGALTLAGNNSLAAITLNSTGGGVSAAAAPTVATGGILNLPAGGTITATSNNVAQTSLISGTLGFTGGVGNVNVSPIGTAFNAGGVAPLVATLNISAAINNASSLNVTGGGVLQLSGASVFNGGVNLAGGTTLLLTANSTQNANTSPVSGPLGTGTFTIGNNSTVLSNGAISVSNAVNLSSAFTIDSNSNAANTLTLGAGSQVTAVAAGGSTINVNAPQMTGVLGGRIVGSGPITKTGMGTLQFNGQYNGGFTGGVVVNNGTVAGLSNSGSPFGTGDITLGGGALQLRANPGLLATGTTLNNTFINWGNNVTINSALPAAFIDINNNGGASNGNIIVMGSLNYTGATTPSTILNITGGNNYFLQFTGTNLNSFGGAVTMNVGAGLSLILPGGLNHLPSNVGAGSLLFSGSNAVPAPTIGTGTTLIAAPVVNTNNGTPLGTGAITLAGGTLQVTPLAGTLSSTGYSSGGLTGKYYFTGQTIMSSAPNWGISPNAVVGGIMPSDANYRAVPQTVENPTGPTQTSMAVYSGLLNVTTGGTYTFGGGSDDQLQILVDGQAIVTDITTGGHGLNQIVPGTINLTSGLHQITVRGFNNGGGGGVQAFYSGPDTVANGIGNGFIAGFQAIPLSKTFYSTAAPTLANNYLNSAILNNDVQVTSSSTIDGLGTDFNQGVKTMTVANGSTLTLANGNGTTQFGSGIFTVTGLTTITDGSVVLNTTTGTLNLAGGVSDNGGGFTKTGSGTLILGNNGQANNTTFTGTFNIAGGYVQLSDAGGLTTGQTIVGANGNAATLDLAGVNGTKGTIVLNGGAGPTAKTSNVGGGLYNSSAATATVTGALQIGSSLNSVNPTVSGFGDIVISGLVTDNGQSWQKTGVNTLTLTNAGNSLTGNLTVAGGLLKMGATDTVGTSGTVTVNAGSALDLAGFNLTSKSLTISGAGVAGAPMNSSAGALVNSSLTSASLIGSGGSVTLAAASNVGSPSNAVLAPFSLTTPGAGDITIAAPITGAFTLTKVGGDNLYLNSSNNTFSAFTVNQGTLDFNGSGTLSVVAATNQINPTASLVLDNSVTAVSNRLGGRGLWENGNLNIIGNAGTGVTEQITNTTANLALGNGFTGEGVITLDASSGGFVNLIVGGSANGQTSTSTVVVNRSVVGSTLLVRGTGLGSAAAGTAGTAGLYGTGTATSPGTIIGNSLLNIALPNRGIVPWALVDNTATGNGMSFAAFDATKGFQPLNATDVNANILSPFTQGSFSTTTASTAITLTAGSTSTLVAGELVSGTNIAAGTYIASITDATHLVLSANATGTATGVTFTMTPDFNVSSAAAQTVAPNTLATINSLTLNSGGSVAIGANTFLALDSGGVLGIGNASISGAGTLTTTLTANREFIFHTPNPDAGGTTTLTVGTQMFTQAGLTKAENGTLALGNTAYIFGNVSLNGGTTKLNANGQGANTFFPLLSTIQTSTSGDTVPTTVFAVNGGATLDLNGANQALSSLSSNVGTATNSIPLTGGTVTNTSATTATLEFTANQSVTWAGNITGNLNVVRDSGNTYTMNSPNTFTGTFTTLGGNTVLTDLGTIGSASAVNIKHSALTWTDTGLTANGSRISATAPITFDGGAFVFNPRSAAGYSNSAVDAISLGAINLSSGASLIQMNPNNGGVPQITIPGLPSRNLGTTLTINAGQGMTGDNPFLKFSTPGTNVNGILPAWLTAAGAIDPITGTAQPEFAVYDPATGVRPVEYPTSNFGPGLNTRLNGSFTLPGGGVTTNSFTFSQTGNGVTIAFVNPTDTLTLQSGGLIAGTDANTRSLGTTAIPGQLTTSAGQNELFVYDAAPVGNPFTINSKIVDNGSGSLNVVLGTAMYGTSNGNLPTVVLTNGNTYGGTTFVNGIALTLNNATGSGFAVPGDLVMNGGVSSAGTDALNALNTIVQLSRANQLNPNASVTMNGATFLQLNSNAQTIKNLTFHDDAASFANLGPTVFTGTSALIVTGTINSSSPQTRSSTPLISGLLTLNGSGAQTINVDANPYQPMQIELALNAAITADSTAASITKSGGGFLGLGGQSGYAGTMNVTGGGVAFASNNGTLPFYAGDINLNGGTTLDARGISGSVGSIQGSGTVQNFAAGTAATIVAGFDNSTTTFSGNFSTPFSTSLLSFTKMGSGTMNLTGDSSAGNNGTLTVQGGGVTLGGANGKLSFSTIAVASGGIFTLDDSGTMVANRLGGRFLNDSATQVANTTNRNINFNGGNFTILGNASTGVNDAWGTVNSVTGGGILSVASAGTAGVTLTINNFATQGQQTSLLIRGDGLNVAAVGGLATAGNTAIFATALPQLAGGTGANGTTTMAVRPDFLADNSATGLGSGLLTKDSVTGQLRPLNQTTELLSTFTGSGTTNNVGLSALTQMAASTSVGTLTLLNANAGVTSGIVPGNSWGADGTPQKLTVANGGVLALGANNTIGTGQLVGSGVTVDFHVTGTNTLTLNTPSVISASFVKADDGTLVLNKPYYETNNSGNRTVGLNGGTLKLAAGNNTLWTTPTITIPAVTSLNIGKGTLDLNGFNQVLGNLTSSNPQAFAGGTAASPLASVTNSQSNAVNLILDNIAATSTTFGGVISGNVNVYKQQATNNQIVWTLTSPQTYTGATFVQNGSLTLKDQGALLNTSGINLDYGGLVIDNTGLADSLTRVSTATPITMMGGAITLNGRQTNDLVNVGPVSVTQGYNFMTAAYYSGTANSGGVTQLNLAALNVANNAVVNFNNTGGTLGATTNNPRITVTNAPVLTNGIVGGWATVNNGDFAGYVAGQGFGALGSGNNFPGYSGNAITAAGLTDNVNTTATTTVGITGRSINSWRLAAGAATITGIQDPTQVINVNTGGILEQANQAVTIAGGQLTAGGINTAPASLYAFISQNTTTISSQIVNNGAQPVTLVRSGGGILSLSPTISDSVVSVPAGSTTITVPNAAGLFVGMNVTGTNITAGSVITGISGTTVTLNNSTGGTAAANVQISFTPPTLAGQSVTQGNNVVTLGTVPAGFVPTVGMAVGGPTIAGGTTITAVAGNQITLSQAPLATSATAALTLGALSNTYTGGTINNGGASVFGSMTLAGQAGSVVIPGDLSLGNASVTMATNQGQIASTANVNLQGGGTLTLVGTNTLNAINANMIGTSGGNGGVNIVAGGILNLAGATAVNANNDIFGVTPSIINGTLNFTNAAGTSLNVTGLSSDGILISSVIGSAAGPISKTGSGTLVLTGANTFSGTFNLNQGTVLLGNAAALGTSNLVLANGATLDGFAASATNLTINNAVQFSGTNPTVNFGGTSNTASINNQLTLSGPFTMTGVTPTFNVVADNLTDTISGTLTGNAGFIKAGPGALTVSGNNGSSLTGAVSVNNGMLTLGNVAALGSAGVDVTVGSTGGLNINALAASIGSLSGGGLVTNSGALQTLTIGTGSDVNNTTFSGVLTAATPANLLLNKAGTNTLTLTNANLFTGATTVSGGTLALQNGTATATAATLANTAVTVNPGATLAPTIGTGTLATVNVGTTAGSVTLQAGATSGASLDMRDAAIGTFKINQAAAATGLTIGNATAGQVPANLFFDLGSTSNDAITVGGIATVGAGTGGLININLLAGNTPSTVQPYTLITGAAGSNLNSANLTLSPSTLSSLTVLSGGQIVGPSLGTSTATASILTFAPSAATPTTAYFTGAQGANWTSFTVSGGQVLTNFASNQPGTTDTHQLPGATTDVIVGADNNTVQITNLNNPFAVNSLTFGGAGNGSGSTINSGTGSNTLTVGAGGITANSGTNTINVPVIVNATQTWTNNSTGPLAVTGAVTGTGTLSTTGTGTTVITSLSLPNLNVNGGLLQYGTTAAGATTPIAITSTLSVATGATAAFAATPGGALANSAPSGVTHGVNNLSIAGGGTVDLANHNLLTSTPVATVQQYLANGFNNGNWNGANNAGGVGAIQSSSATATAAGTSARALGYASGADVASGLVSPAAAALIGANQTLVKYTTPADFNLSGGTDFNDFLSLQNNYNKPGGWAAGDADYNGVVNFNDFLILQNNFNHNLPPAAAPVAGQLASAAPLSKSSVNAGPGGVVRPAALASSTVSVAAALTGVPVVKYVLSKNDDGTGKFAAGKFAVYAVDSTADGNQGMVSYGFDVQGFNSVANGLVNFSPRGSYDDGTGNGTANDVGFTILRSVNAPGTVQNVPNPVRGSQDTVAAGANPAIMVFGLGQHSGNLATAAPTSMTAGTVIQPVYNGPSQFSIGATSFQSGLLMVKGTFAGDGSALLWNADLTNDKSNVFISSAVNPVTGTYDTTAAAIQLVTQDLNSTPEPTVLSLFALAGMGLLARRRRVNLVESTQQQRQA